MASIFLLDIILRLAFLFSAEQEWLKSTRGSLLSEKAKEILILDGMRDKMQDCHQAHLKAAHYASTVNESNGPNG
jgi:hypothetical protein